MLVKEIILEAAVRVNLAPQRNPYPTVVENGFRLLQGIVNKYNADNLLNWTQNSVIIPKSNLIHIYDNTDYLKGKYNLYFDNADELNNYPLTEDDCNHDVWAILKDHPNVLYRVMPIGTPDGTTYTWYGVATKEPYPQRYQEMKRYEAMTHIQVRDVAKINSIYVISNNGQPYKEHYSLDFINHTDFDKFTNTSRVFTYTQKSEGEWLIELKPLFYTGDYRLKLNYNEAITFDEGINTEWFIPDNYVELLIVALAHKLALEFPRVDEAQMTRLQNEVSVLVDNVRTPKSVERTLLRKNYWDGYGRMSQSQLLSGEWL
jgi:hypothetical protein